MKMGLAASNHSNIIAAQSVADLQPTYGGGYDMHGGHYGGVGSGLVGDEGGSYSYNPNNHLVADEYNNYNNTLRSTHSTRQDPYCQDPYVGMPSVGPNNGHMEQQLGKSFICGVRLGLNQWYYFVEN